MKILSKPS